MKGTNEMTDYRKTVRLFIIRLLKCRSGDTHISWFKNMQLILIECAKWLLWQQLSQFGVNICNILYICDFLSSLVRLYDDTIDSDLLWVPNLNFAVGTMFNTE